jgi:GH25 family lysozyme M1 (1,4-beta-N-acetylmuramidase)
MKRSKKIMIGLLALVAVGTIAITYRMVSSSKSHIGIDVSHHNHLSSSDWDKLKEKGVSFVYILISASTLIKNYYK